MNGFSSRSISEGLEPLPGVQPLQDLGHDALAFLLVVVAEIAVEDVLAAHGVVDLDFSIVFVELGEVHNAVPPGGFRFAVNFEHHLFGFESREPSLTRPS